LELAQFFWFLFEFAQSFVVRACTKKICFYLHLHKALLLELAQKFVVFCFSLHKTLLLKLGQKFVLFKLKPTNNSVPAGCNPLLNTRSPYL
jgi:hypothetical protein